VLLFQSVATNHLPSEVINYVSDNRYYLDHNVEFDFLLLGF
jgi:hypothetical protein